MKTLLIGLVIGVGIGAGVGLKVGTNAEHTKQMARIHTIESRLERFENEDVFNGAAKVAQITGRPLFQVLTGKKASRS